MRTSSPERRSLFQDYRAWRISLQSRGYHRWHVHVNTAAQIELLLGVDASDRASSGRRPETGVIAGANPDNETYSPDTNANTDVPPTNLSTPRSCAPDDFVCADGTCIPETHHCDHFYDCRDFTDEQYCFG